MNCNYIGTINLDLKYIEVTKQIMNFKRLELLPTVCLIFNGTMEKP